MVIYTPITAYFGYDYRIENGGKIENKGLEFYTFFRLLDRNSLNGTCRQTSLKSKMKLWILSDQSS